MRGQDFCGAWALLPCPAVAAKGNVEGAGWSQLGQARGWAAAVSPPLAVQHLPSTQV